MVSNIGSGTMQQIQNMYQTNQTQGMGQGGGPKGQGLGQLMKSLPQDFRNDLQQTLKSMDETQRKDVVSQLKQLDVANMNQEELMQQIENILNPTTSSSGYNFMIYA